MGRPMLNRELEARERRRHDNLNTCTKSFWMFVHPGSQLFQILERLTAKLVHLPVSGDDDGANV
jgi:hypothetical protein